MGAIAPTYQLTKLFMFKLIQKRKIWFAMSGILCIASIISLFAYGLNLGIDFTGGTLMELNLSDQSGNRPEIQIIKETLGPLELGEINIQPVGESNLFFRLKTIDEETHQKILTSLSDKFNPKNSENENLEIKSINDETIETENENLSNEIIESPDSENENFEIESVATEKSNNENSKFLLEEKRFESIGPVIGSELKEKAIYSIAIALIVIISYIAWAFRKVSRPVSSWKYGVIAIITLFHDILIVLGIFSALGYFFNIEIGTPFVAALLTILGYSVNDTIVVFDRIRENLIRTPMNSFEKTINKGVNETLVRSLNTSFTTLFVLLAIYFFGGETIKYFALALIIGLSFGTYSSVFIASPLLIVWQKWSNRKNN